VVELPFAADCGPCVEKLRTVLPFTVGIRDSVVHLSSTLSSVVISARAELGSIITSALPVATVLTRGGVRRVTQEGVANGSLSPLDVSGWLLEASLYTGDCPPVALLIRTSGETRLSDFMSLQCADAALVRISGSE
jgi:hypothetical protein